MPDFRKRFPPAGVVPCIFGCKEAVGIFHAEFKDAPGCLCHSEPVQALCAQHALKAQQNGVSLRVIAWI